MSAVITSGDLNTLHPMTALQHQRVRIETARSLRALIATSTDRNEALRVVDAHCRLLDEHLTHLLRECAALIADEE